MCVCWLVLGCCVAHVADQIYLPFCICGLCRARNAPAYTHNARSVRVLVCFVRDIHNSVGIAYDKDKHRVESTNGQLCNGRNTHTKKVAAFVSPFGNTLGALLPIVARTCTPRTYRPPSVPSLSVDTPRWMRCTQRTRSRDPMRLYIVIVDGVGLKDCRRRRRRRQHRRRKQ